MNPIFLLIRPQQWIKNFFVFGPVVFGGALMQGQALMQGLLAFAAFSLAASSIYCINDIHDVADDRRHSEKCRRPIASGAVSVPRAWLLAALLLAGALGLAWLADVRAAALPVAGAGPGVGVTVVVGFYWLLNLGYCLRLKQYAIIDVCIVAFGFVLRLLAGSAATMIGLSRWIVLMTFLLTLFMSFAKRRDDVLLMEATGEAPRKNTIHYNTTFINQAITITAAVTLVCYIMYTVSPEVVARFHNENLYLTSVFVLVGLLRYIQISVVEQKSGNPTKVILRDHFIQIDVLAWFVAFLVLIYA